MLSCIIMNVFVPIKSAKLCHLNFAIMRIVKWKCYITDSSGSHLNENDFINNVFVSLGKIINCRSQKILMIFTSAYVVFGKVMSSVVSVCLQGEREVIGHMGPLTTWTLDTPKTFSNLFTWDTSTYWQAGGWSSTVAKFVWYSSCNKC